MLKLPATTYLRTFAISLVLLTAGTLKTKGQTDDIKYELESQAGYTSNSTVPFWLRSNQYGSIPISGASGSFIGRAFKDYDRSRRNRGEFNWAFGLEGRANVGKNSNFNIIEAYLKGKLGIFQLKAGRSRDVTGYNGDTTLSSGNFAVSGNALGIPKVEVSIPDYYRIPFLSGLFSFKGNFVHGWLGQKNIYVVTNYDNPAIKTSKDAFPQGYYHQKSLYVRFGKEDWKLNLFGGFNHQVYWDDQKAAYGSFLTLSKLETFFYVATGKTYGTGAVPRSKIGNQLGSIDIGAEYSFENVRVILYRQSFYDVGALSKLGNIADGLNGVSFENRNFEDQTATFRFKKATLELFYTKNQAGYPWSVKTLSGDEDYYNNYYFKQGWSYKNVGMGNPLITRKADSREGQASNAQDYFINNRVLAFHGGLSGSIGKWDVITKATYSKNFGTFGTSIYGKSGNGHYTPNTTNVFIPVNQISLYAEAQTAVSRGYVIGAAAAVDRGKLLDNSVGIQFKIIRKFQ
ncbi:capsule assembly Wzi family protein [Pedobacter duraquae]|uniref:Capsule assembly protein Wzi n=1 Tax=Pedobacter duraquae TaxID=425511 RepID=A0A4V6PSA9_9SPHI|nr:capsule assembly Wzi family protein [Pedobacter duraquae]TDO19029.1 capsule assembly protein Wzi [Pedobacter duraquae]